MKNFKLPLCILLVLTLFLAPLIGYADQTDEVELEESTEIESVTTEEAIDVPAEDTDDVESSAEDAVDEPADDVESDTEEAAFSYSDGIDENGLWEGIVALDYVELSDYVGITIPSDTHTISDDAVQSEIDSILLSYTTEEHITDQAVEDGDTVNIDYVGSVDGVEFDSGSTEGYGTDVTIGVTSYIDDFLEQLIGHLPGETINVEVTFPEDYGVDELNGQDAVFVTTINYIVNAVEQELTDDFVVENLSASYGWSNVDEMKESIRSDLQSSSIESYIQDQILGIGTISSIPEQLITYQEDAMLSYYEMYAEYFGMDLDSFLSTYMGVSSVDELCEGNYDSNAESAKYYLVTQAIAEDAGISATDEDIADFFKEYYDADDYSSYEEEYGMPYLKQNVLCLLVVNHMVDNAILE